MKHLIVIISLTLATLSFAQKSEVTDQQKILKERVERRLETLKTELSLTESQITQIRPILESRQQKRMANREEQMKEGKPMKSNRELMSQDRVADTEKMKKILTPEQYKKLEGIRRD